MPSRKSSTLAQIRIRARWQLARLLLKVRPRKDARRFAVGVVKVDRLGDFVLAVSAIRILTERFGQENCLLVLSPFAQELAAREFPHTPQLIMPPFVPKKLRRIVPLWQKQRGALAGTYCEQLLSLRHTPTLYRDTLLNWVPAAQRRGVSGPFPLGEFSGGEFPFATKTAFPSSAPAGSCLDLECHRIVVSQALGREISSDEIKPRLTSIPLRQGDYLFVAPFGSDPVRDYPAPSLLVALKLLQQHYACPIRVLAGPDQGERLQIFRQRAQALGLSFVSCEAGAKFEDYLTAIGGARAILTMESASAHAAAAMDKPTVTLLGGGHYGLFSPWQRSPRQQWLHHSMECFGCNWTCCHSENYCLSRIQPHEIVSALSTVAFAPA
jgi:ADP-heptose:LPS heptosyltransferase